MRNRRKLNSSTWPEIQKLVFKIQIIDNVYDFLTVEINTSINNIHIKINSISKNKNK